MKRECSACDARDGDERQRIWDEAREHFEDRALIEQSTGMLMFVYGIDADEAFDVLRKHSQEHNIKLRLIAEQILKDLLELAHAKGPARQITFGSLIPTAHYRIAHVAARQLDGQSKTGVAMKDPLIPGFPKLPQLPPRPSCLQRRVELVSVVLPSTAKTLPIVSADLVPQIRVVVQSHRVPGFSHAQVNVSLRRPSTGEGRGYVMEQRTLFCPPTPTPTPATRRDHPASTNRLKPISGSHGLVEVSSQSVRRHVVQDQMLLHAVDDSKVVGGSRAFGGTSR